MDSGEPLPASELELSLAATPEAVREAREAVVAFALQAGVEPRELEGIRLAVSEAVTNAVVHAYRTAPGLINVSAAQAGEELWVLVADDGCGFRVRSDSPGLGLGLIVITRLCQEMRVVHRSTGGTEVRMRFPLSVAGEEAESRTAQQPLIAAPSCQDAARLL